MFQADYIRDMHNNFLVLNGLKDNVSGYGVKMLLNNTIQGLLKVELRCIDHMDLFYYDITSLKSIYALYEDKLIKHEELRNILNNIFNTIENGEEYLLSENDFIIDPKYIFINSKKNIISLCHLVGYQENIQVQLIKFMEYLMNKVDYEDEKAVLLIYALYKVSREEDCTYQKFHQELNKNSYDDMDNSPINLNRNGKIESTAYPLKSNQDRFNTKQDTAKDNKSKNITKTYDTKSGITKDDSTKNNRNKNNTTKNNDLNMKTSSTKTNRMINNKSKNNSIINKCKINGRDEKRKKQNDIKNKLFNKNKNEISNKDYRNKKDRNDNIYNLIMDEVECEREISCFDQKTYILAGLSVVAGFVLVILALKQKLLYNSFGTHIDFVKLICCVIIIGLVEIFVMFKLFDKKNQITRMETNIEYISQQQENDLLQKVDMPENKSKNNNLNRSNIETVEKIENKLDERTDEETDEEIDEESNEKTMLLWTEEEDTDKTMVLAEFSSKIQYFLESHSTNDNKINHTSGNIKDNSRILINAFPFIVGKCTKGVNFTLEDASISRIHAKFTKEDDKTFVTDLTSTNGTYLNGVRLIANKPYELTVGDEISFSNLKYSWKEKNLI
jgi:hypothetical protein